MRGRAHRDRPGRTAGNSGNRLGRDKRARRIFAKVMPGPRVGRVGRVRQHGAAGAQGAQNLTQRTPRRGRKGGNRRKLRQRFRIAPATRRFLAGQRLAQKGGRLGKIRLSTRFRASPMASRKLGFIILSSSEIHQRKRSASAVLTSAGACSAPSTVIDSIVALARSGVTSSAMTARPSTRILSRSPPPEQLRGPGG